MKIEVVKEIRFAVVMYGGVSLAIYINGVAQELLRMVRATAVDEVTDEFMFDDDKLDKVEKNYRTLAYLLGDYKLKENFFQKLKTKVTWEDAQKNLNNKVKNQSTTKVVRFVVDILSGSSAGGINAIYLSKALANGQNINNLEKLWLKEGDFSLLLNDKQSTNKTKLKLSKDPTSLFNSQRMYLKLLQAFEEMDNTKNPPINSMVDEVDLFVTLTDFWGTKVPIKLFDKVISERTHRRRLHFKYRHGAVNDFTKNHYSFLAYAARCTSSFPVAFEPMKLSDTKAVLDVINADKRNRNEEKIELPKEWKKYFLDERIKLDSKQTDWENRVFVDGGTLDNKPFGHAIEALSQKQANVLIDRKLIYVEPKPDLDGDNERSDWIHRPNAIKNTIGIVATLPSYETIREDLHQVLERNRLIEKVNYIVSNAQKDEYQLLKNLVKNDIRKVIRDNSNLKEVRGNKAWAKLTIAEIAQHKGQSIYPYYRLRLSALTDDLAKLSARRAGFDESSDYFLAIRSLVRAWRLENYNKDEYDQNQKSIPQFLYDYDFNYRLRRLRFILQEIDKLLSALSKINFNSNKIESFANLSEQDIKENKFSADLKKRYDLISKLKTDENFQKNLQQNNASQILQQKFPLIEDELFDSNAVSPIMKIFEAKKDELEPILRDFKKDINNHLKKLSARQQLIETRSDKDILKDDFLALNKNYDSVAKKLKNEHFTELLDDNNSQYIYDLESSNKKGNAFLKQHHEIKEGIDKIAKSLLHIYNGNDLSKTSKNNSLFGEVREIRKSLSPSLPSEIPLKNAVSSYLYHFYENFDSYDQIIFPITYETPIGEGDIVEVARISPADAISLIDEEKEKKKKRKEDQRKKLAGDTFFSFSAFFKENWRKNDIMWGRLDAVERLTELVMSDNCSKSPIEYQKTLKIKKNFITATQKNILIENKDQLLNNYTNKNIDLIWLIKNEYKIDQKFNKNSIMKVTYRTLNVLTKILRSPNEFTDNGTLKFKEANKYTKSVSRIIKPFAQITKASTYTNLSISENSSFVKSIFPILKSQIQMNWIVIFLMLSIPSLFNILIFGVFILKYFFALDWGKISDEKYNFAFVIIILAFIFNMIFFGLVYCLKNYIFRKLTKKLI